MSMVAVLMIAMLMIAAVVVLAGRLGSGLVMVAVMVIASGVIVRSFPLRGDMVVRCRMVVRRRMFVRRWAVLMRRAVLMRQRCEDARAQRHAAQQLRGESSKAFGGVVHGDGPTGLDRECNTFAFTMLLSLSHSRCCLSTRFAPN